MATCKSVKNPSFFGLTMKDVIGEEIAEIPLRNPIKEKYPVVTCFSPLFFNERWQLVLISIEFYKHYGVDIQDYYFMSSTAPILEILKVYERLKVIQITPWALPEDGKFEMQYRNQAAAHSDCLLKFRESADFIIVGDIDDLLIPIKTNNFFNEFVTFQNYYPDSAYFVFQRLNSKIEVSEKLEHFQISKSLKNIKLGTKRPSAKSVYSTKHVEAVWIHWAYLLRDGFKRIDLDVGEGHFIHLRDWDFLKNENAGTFDSSVQSIIPSDAMESIEKRLTAKLDLLPKLNTSTFYYYGFIDDCYKGFFAERTLDCPTHLNCKIPKIVGLKCAQSTSEFSKHKLSDTFSITVPEDPVSIEILENGCIN